MKSRAYSHYGAIFEALKARESFRGNSACGVRCDDGKFGTDNGARAWYSVYSYSTLILRYDLIEHRITFFDGSRYSNTTTRLQNLIRQAFAAELEEYGREERAAIRRTLGVGSTADVDDSNLQPTPDHD